MNIEEWAMNIKRVSNGFVVTRPPQDEGLPDLVSVYQFDEDNLEDHINAKNRNEAVISMLWDMIEYFNVGGSKRSKYRITILNENQEENNGE